MTKGKQGKNNYDAAEYNAVQRDVGASVEGKQTRLLWSATLPTSQQTITNNSKNSKKKITNNNQKQPTIAKKQQQDSKQRNRLTLL